MFLVFRRTGQGEGIPVSTAAGRGGSPQEDGQFDQRKNFTKKEPPTLVRVEAKCPQFMKSHTRGLGSRSTAWEADPAMGAVRTVMECLFLRRKGHRHYIRMLIRYYFVTTQVDSLTR